jgi:hypothetical protein
VTILKYAMLTIAVGCFFYGLFVMLPTKMKLGRKHGLHMTNADFIRLANEGDAEIAAFYKKSKIFGLVFAGSAMLTVLLNHLTKAQSCQLCP